MPVSCKCPSVHKCHLERSFTSPMTPATKAHCMNSLPMSVQMHTRLDRCFVFTDSWAVKVAWLTLSHRHSRRLCCHTPDIGHLAMYALLFCEK